MIVDERMVSFINSLDSGNTEELNRIERIAKETFVPIIRSEMQSLLKILLAMNQPKTILEVGTAIGFSSLFMSEYAPKDCKITTIENYDKRIVIAKENIKALHKDNSITLIEGDAIEILPTLKDPFDLIFMDAAKGQYIHFLPEIMRILPLGGVLISDNVLQEGELIESRFVIPRRNRTIHSRMREYLYELKHNEQLETAILPVGDGVAISVRK